jgi:hypothetical protein
MSGLPQRRMRGSDPKRSPYSDQVFSDGVLYQFDVPADTDVRPIPGGW